ncbi:MAG: recombinase family protein [Clostridiaceae bacterium]|nr:recombinase family protein [Clostridiaceae bacterium]
MNIAYVKISTIEQNESRELEDLKKYDIDKWFSEKVSSKDTNRPVLKRMIEFARKDDIIYIHSLDRIARSTKDLLNIVEQLQVKGIHLVSSKENIDTTTATGKLMLTMIDSINTFERANMLERQREGISIAKENGVYKGRKAIRYPNNWFVIYSQYKTRVLTGTKAMNLLGLKRNTFYKLLKKYEEG